MSSASEVPNHRACASCRGQKVRCIPSDDPDVCQRCSRTGRPCVVTPLQKRKQRKRTDTRVAELEREMRAMRSALKQKEESVAGSARTGSPGRVPELPPTQPKGLWYKDHQPSAPRISQAANWERVEEDQSLNVPRTGPGLWPWKFQNKPPDHNTPDVVDRGMISMATARHLFETYKKDLFPHYPMVAVPETITAEQMRKEKPALFLAIIAAAAGKDNSDLSAALDQEVLQAYATRSLVQSEKSLELVQALLISAVWYHPPTKFGQLKYYEYIHMAATMAMDLGIGARPQSRRGYLPPKQNAISTKAIHPAEDVGNPDLSMAPRSARPEGPDTESIESRRTFLACYIICAGVSVSLRRPNMLRVTSYIRECADFLDRSPHALPTDAILVAWVRLNIISEEISGAFSYDDPGGMASITDLRIQLMLKDFEKRLSAWYSDLPETGVGTGSLMLMYYTMRLYLFEIALHVDHSPEDFRAPYQMGGIQISKDADEIPTQALAEAIADCITSSHALLTTFLAMDPESCRALPVFSYVRVSFAAFVLAKLCLSAAHPRSRIGRVLDRTSLKVETYLDRAILHVRNIVGERKSRVPSIFLALLFKLRQWSLNPEIIDSDQNWHQDRGITRVGADSDDNNPQQVIDLDGPRVTEHISSTESSPQTVGSDSHHSNSNAGLSSLRNVTPMAGSSPMPPPQEADNAIQYNSLGRLSALGLSGNTHASAAGDGLAVSGSAPLGPANDWPMSQMDIDNNLMQLLGDVNAFSEGGLTGLDDWASVPMDFANMDMSSWTIPENS